MCYDISVNLQRQLKAAKRIKDEKVIKEIMEKIEKLETKAYHHVSGFVHPQVLIYTNEQPKTPILSQWGLIPHWSKSPSDAKKIWNNTLNARGETIFEKPSYRDSAHSKRCLIYVDGFFEHHHLDGRTYPFHIRRKDGEQICLGGLWSEWEDRESGEVLNTFSIVTNRGNKAMSIIHNNPKMKEARMPFILPEELQDEWLQLNTDDSMLRERLTDFFTPCPSDHLEYFPVRKLRGRKALGNSENAVKEFDGYPELWITTQSISEVA